MDIRKWEKKGEPKILAKGFGRAFFRQDFINPKNGKVLDFYIFSAHKTVFIFSLTKNNEVVCVRQYKQGADEITYEIPGGIVDKNEDEKAAAARELLEETGFQASEMVDMGLVSNDARASTIWRHLFFAKDCVKVREIRPDDDEEIEVLLIPLQNWLDMVRKGEVLEATTLACTLRALAHLKKITP